MTKRSRLFRKVDIAHLVRATAGVLDLGAMRARNGNISNPNAPEAAEIARCLQVLSVQMRPREP